MIVKIKQLSPEATIPTYAKESDAGMDLVATSKTVTPEFVEYGTGLALEIPERYVGLVFPRSSISKHDLLLCNSVGVIDSGYRGELKCRFKRVEMADVVYHNIESAINSSIASIYLSYEYGVGEKVAQLVIIPHPKVTWEVVEELSSSDRGEGGFGSTGK